MPKQPAPQNLRITHTTATHKCAIEVQGADEGSKWVSPNTGIWIPAGQGDFWEVMQAALMGQKAGAA